MNDIFFENQMHPAFFILKTLKIETSRYQCQKLRKQTKRTRILCINQKQVQRHIICVKKFTSRMKSPNFLFVLRNQKHIKITHIVSIRNCRIKVRNTHAICVKNINSKQRVTLFILETMEAYVDQNNANTYVVTLIFN